QRRADAGRADLLAKCEAQIVRAADERGIRFGRFTFHDDHAPWKVRLMTSICCSRVRRTKFTAYPETRMVRLGYFSGCATASSNISRFKTLTYAWYPLVPKNASSKPVRLSRCSSGERPRPPGTFVAVSEIPSCAS